MSEEREITRDTGGGWVTTLLYGPLAGTQVTVRRLTIGELSRRAAAVQEIMEGEGNVFPLVPVLLGDHTSLTPEQIDQLDPEDFAFLTQAIDDQLGKMFGRGNPTPSSSR